jgi:PKD repeat protein
MKLLKLLGLFLALSIISCTKDPAACFETNKGNPTKLNEETQFDATCSVNSETYAWDFGGLGTATGITTKYKFTKSGKYIIKLIASKGGKNSEFIQEITIP